MSLLRILVVSLALGCSGKGISVAQEASTPLQRIMVIAREAKLPLGIVLGADRSLCQAGTWPLPNRTADPIGDIGAIGRRYGYTLDGTGPPVLRNSVTVSEHLREGLRFRYSNFPSLRGTMPYLSATLAGWMLSEYGHAGGWAMSIGSAPGAEEFQLSASVGASTEEIADKIVSLSGGGIWIASDQGGDAANGLRLRAYSYADDLKFIQFVKCD